MEQKTVLEIGVEDMKTLKYVLELAEGNAVRNSLEAFRALGARENSFVKEYGYDVEVLRERDEEGRRIFCDREDRAVDGWIDTHTKIRALMKTLGVHVVRV